MTPLVILILLGVSVPCVVGLLLQRRSSRGYLTTPAWLVEFDQMLLKALPGGGGAGGETSYVFPPPVTQQKVFGWKVRPCILNEIVADYRFTHAQALKNWE